MVDILQRINQDLMRPGGRDRRNSGIPEHIYKWMDDVVDQFVNWGERVNELVERLETLITEARTGFYRIHAVEILEELVTEIEMPEEFDPGYTIVSVDKRTQWITDFTEIQDASGAYKIIRFAEPLSYNAEYDDTGPRVLVIYRPKLQS